MSHTGLLYPVVSIAATPGAAARKSDRDTSVLRPVSAGPFAPAPLLAIQYTYIHVYIDITICIYRNTPYRKKLLNK